MFPPKAIPAGGAPQGNEKGKGKGGKSRTDPDVSKAKAIILELAAYSTEALWETKVKARKIENLTTQASLFSSKFSDQSNSNHGEIDASLLLRECERVDTQFKVFMNIRMNPQEVAHCNSPATSVMGQCATVYLAELVMTSLNPVYNIIISLYIYPSTHSFALLY
jgi:hypothetical protein